MTEPGPSSRFESVIEEQIRQAQERGDFDDLPGMGKPLPGRGQPDDDLWWVRQYVKRERLDVDPLLPPSLQLAKEIERLPETVAKLPSEQDVREAVSELNRRIADYLRAPSGPRVPVAPVNADRVVAQWRAARQASTKPAADPPADPPADQPAPARRRRWFTRRRSSSP